jgi:hypothetical protein
MERSSIGPGFTEGTYIRNGYLFLSHEVRQNVEYKTYSISLFYLLPKNLNSVLLGN